MKKMLLAGLVGATVTSAALTPVYLNNATKSIKSESFDQMWSEKELITQVLEIAEDAKINGIKNEYEKNYGISSLKKENFSLSERETQSISNAVSIAFQEVNNGYY